LRKVDLAPPRGWHSRHCYETDGYFGNDVLPKRPAKIVLTPFAEAGQSGGEYRVWLQGGLGNNAHPA
jgi:hypothetical protein